MKKKTKKIPLGTLTIVGTKKKPAVKKAKAKKPAVKKPKVKIKKIVFDYKSLSRDILAKRTKEDLSFRVVAKTAGIPVHNLHAMELGKQVPSCVNLAKVLGWLGRTANTYFVTIAKSK